MNGFLKGIFEAGVVLGLTISAGVFKMDLNDIIQNNLKNLPNIAIEQTQKEFPGTFDPSKLFNNNGQRIDPKLKIQYIAVGSGEAVLLSAQGEVVLIDGGPEEYKDSLYEYLKEYRIKKINSVIITTPTKENIGALDKIIEEFDVEKVYSARFQDREDEATKKEKKELLDAADKKILKLNYIKEGEKIKIGQGEFTVLNSGNRGENIKEQSLVLNLKYYDKSFMFTNGIDKNTLKKINQKYNLGKVEIFKAPDKGKDNTIDYMFLNTIKPAYSIIIQNDETPVLTDRTGLDIRTIKQIGGKLYTADKKKTIQVIYDGQELNIQEVNNTLKRKTN